MPCRNYHELMKTEIADLSQAIDENKWYLSEKLGHDVGPETATSAFLEDHIEEWATRWRKEWCDNRCGMRSECEYRYEFCKNVNEQGEG